MSEDKYGVRFSIPDDKTLEEQLRMAKSIREIMTTFATATGELDGLDLSDVDNKIAILEAKLSAPQDNKGTTE